MKLEVIEEVISKVSTFQSVGKIWFNQKINDPSLKAKFLQGEEESEKKGRGID